MGVCSSKKLVFVPNEDIEGQDDTIYEIAPLMEIEDEEINILYTVFKEVDVHKSGNIQPVDIFTFMNSDYSTFEKQVFQIFDADRSGKFNFLEFVCCMWNLLTIPENQLGAIVYLMKDSTGVLRVLYSDLKDMFDVVHKRKLESSSTMQSIFHDLRDNFTPDLSIQDVVKWSAKVGNNNILTPLLLLQIKLRKFVIGEKYWLAKTAKRAADPQQSRVEYIKEFQNIIKNKLYDCKKKKELAAAQKKVQSRNRMGRAEANIARKQSILLDVFKLKGKSSTANSSPNRVVPTAGAPSSTPTTTIAEESKADTQGKLFQENSSPSKKSTKSKSSAELNDNSNTPEPKTPSSKSNKKQSSNVSARSSTLSSAESDKEISPNKSSRPKSGKKK